MPEPVFDWDLYTRKALITEQLEYDREHESNMAVTMVLQLNPKQQSAYNTILSAVISSSEALSSSVDQGVQARCLCTVFSVTHNMGGPYCPLHGIIRNCCLAPPRWTHFPFNVKNTNRRSRPPLILFNQQGGQPCRTSQIRFVDHMGRSADATPVRTRSRFPNSG